MTTERSSKQDRARAEPTEDSSGRPGRERVLFVIDDDPALVDSLSEVLVDEGYGVECFTEPAEALRRLRAGARPDAILLDHVMPDMSGPEFLDAMVDARVDVPVVLLSGLSDPDLRPGTVATILFKPFDIDRLLLEINQVIERSTAPTRIG